MTNFKKKIELAFEVFLWKSRFITLLAVLFSLLSSLALFVAGSYQILAAFSYALPQGGQPPQYKLLLSDTISAVDLYLFALVFLIFSFGIYELFLSKIDPAHRRRDTNILEIRNLDDLKNRLVKVIIMALIVYFFKTILDTPLHTPLEMLDLGAAILMVAAASFFIRKME